VRALQRDILTWQREKHGHNDPALTALKLCEEAGEVAGAVLKYDGAHIVQEMGDVMISLLALAEILEVDLDRVATTRWAEVKTR
jgi:NTP pyrophosphatase (non-canonical NTP hydrolase)